MPLRDLPRDAALRIPRVKAFYAHTQSIVAERNAVAAERDGLRDRAEEAEGRAEAAAHRIAQLEAHEQQLVEALQGEARLLDALYAAEGERDALRDQLAQAEARIGLAEQGGARLQALERDLAAAQKEAADRQAELQDERSRLSTEKEEVELRHYVLTSDHHRAVAMNDDLLRELAAKEEMVAAERAERARLTGLIARLEVTAAEAGALQTRNADLEQARVGLDAEARQLRSRAAELEGQVELDAERHAELEQALQGLEAEARQLRSRAAELERQVEMSAERHSELERLSLALQTRVTETEQARQDREAEAGQLRGMAENLANEVRRLEAARGEASSRIETLNAEVARLSDAELVQQQAWAAERTALTDELGALRVEAGQMRLSAELAAERERAASAELSEVRTRVALMQQEIERLQNEERRLAQARAELDDLRAQVAVLEHEAARGRAQEAALTEARAEAAALMARVGAAEAEVEIIRRDTPPLLGATEAIRTQLTQLLGATASAQDVTDTRDRLSSRLQILAYDVDAIRRGLTSADDGSGSEAARRLYLDLLESALTGELTHDPNMAPWGGETFDADRRLYGRDWPRTALTMIGTARMRNLRELTETVLRDGVEGDLLEAGVWRGGACIYMRGVLAAYGDTDRRVWVADSFAGLPLPDPKRYPADKGDTHHTVKELIVPLEEVKAGFDRFGLLDRQVQFLPGWFKDTLAGAPVDRLAILRLDGDMYGSTMETLEALHHRVTPGGFVIVDDYILPGARKAVDDFREQRRITDPIQDVDGAAVFWRRSGA